MTKQRHHAQIKLYVLVGILAIVSLSYRLILYTKLEQTSLLFVGLPTYWAKDLFASLFQRHCFMD